MSGVLGLGKVPRIVFDRCVLPFIPLDKNLELDGATIGLADGTVIAHSPSIGVPIEALGFFAFHYAASNVACKFGRPTHMITGIYLPLNTKERDLAIIAKSLGDEAKKYGVKIAAGQTAVYNGLEIPFVSTTCLGGQVKKVSPPREGDVVLLIGEVGGEAVWLTNLSEGLSDDRWRTFTALPIILSLQRIEGIRLMHDVSEGGVKAALLEALCGLGLSLSFNSSDVTYADSVKSLNQDILRAPTYGTTIIVAAPKSVGEVFQLCTEKGVKVSRLGSLKSGTGLFVDRELVVEQNRVAIDELYGSFKKTNAHEKEKKTG